MDVGFHPNADSDIQLSNGGLVATGKRSGVIQHTILYSSLPLDEGDTFTVNITKATDLVSSVSYGTVMNNSNCTFTFV